MRSKLAVAAIAVVLLVSSGMAYTIPAHVIARFREWQTSSYAYLATKQPYFPRSFGTVSGMPMFMLESIRTQTSTLTDTIRFSRAIACPFVAGAAATMTANVKVFRDYFNDTPLSFTGTTADSLWVTFPGEAQSFVISYAAADTPSYFLIGGYALPAPR